jgi:hypothetical protein
MKSIDAFEFQMLAGTALMADMITNKVQICLKDTDKNVHEIVESVSISMYYVRHHDFDHMATLYFANPIDRSRFMDVYENQKI